MTAPKDEPGFLWRLAVGSLSLLLLIGSSLILLGCFLSIEFAKGFPRSPGDGGGVGGWGGGMAAAGLVSILFFAFAVGAPLMLVSAIGLSMLSRATARWMRLPIPLAIFLAIFVVAPVAITIAWGSWLNYRWHHPSGRSTPVRLVVPHA